MSFIEGDAPRSAPVLRFLDKLELDEQTGCWMWTGAVVESGRNKGALYGALKRGGKFWLAHRWAYHTFAKPITNKKTEVHHKCFRTLCCRPDHLEAVSDRYGHVQLDRAIRLAMAAVEEPPPHDPRDDDLPF